MPERFHHRSAAVAPAAIAVAAAMFIGGSGSLVPLPEIVLECLLAAVTAAWVWIWPDNLRHVPRGAWIIAALMLAVPLCQLVPLPPAMWHALPGRAVEIAALDLVDQGSSWRPLSLTPNRTLASLLAMMAAAAVLAMAAAQDRRGRTVLIAIVAAIAVLSVLAGAAQVSSGNGGFFRFYNPEEAYLDGFQTNHNAAADVLLIGMVTLAASAADWARGRKLAVDPWRLLGSLGAVTLLMILGVVMTGSRTGIGLLPIAIGAQGLILRAWLTMNKRGTAIAAVIILAALGLTALALGHHGAWGRVWARFDTLTDFRPEIWRDSLFALRQVWPWGSGMGSFVPVFAAAERLEAVTQLFVNRAHDDYLEFMIEAGVPGLIILSLVCGQIIYAGWQGWRARVDAVGSCAQLICGATNLIVIMAHSLDDYPLRTLSIACITAVSAALLLPSVEGSGPGVGKHSI